MELPFNFHFSLGLTSDWTESTNLTTRGYSWFDIYRMHLFTAKRHFQFFQSSFAFTVRAVYCNLLNLPQLFWLLRTYPGSTLFVWSHAAERNISIPNINQLLQKVPTNRLMFDIPKDFYEELHTNISDVSCLRLFNTSQCFQSDVADFNGRLSPVTLLDGKDTDLITLRSFHDYSYYSLSGVIEYMVYGQDKFQAIHFISNNASNTPFLSLQLQSPSNVSSDIYLSSGESFAYGKALCDTCLHVRTAYKFNLQLDLRRKIANATITRIHGSFVSRFNVDWGEGSPLELSKDLEIGEAENVSLIFKAADAEVIFYHLKASRF